MNDKVSFRIPASTANLGPGFDALSLALARYLTITLEPAEMLEIVATGSDTRSIPTTSDNLIYRVAQSAAVHHRKPLPPFRMTIHNEIPLARGMGSSAAAIIAGITVYELLTGDSLAEQDLFATAFDFENHPDNLSAALYGGLVAAAAAEDGTVMVSRLKIPVKLSAVLVIPAFELSTGKARAVLPPKYPFQDVVFNIQRAALTIAALTTGNLPMIREAMRDRVHQPYRAKLIPGLDEILAFEMKGLLGAALSGAGPTVFALAEPEYAEKVGQSLAAIFKKHGSEATHMPIDIDTTGRVIERP
jgi:homoserine kinase